MYLPRQQISQLYSHLVKSTHPLSPPVLILTSLTVDALCSTRMLTALLKRDYIPHKVQPVSGYADLQNAGRDLVLPLTRQRGGEGGVVVCLGVGGLVDLEEVLGLDASANEDQPETNMRNHGVEVWVIDARRPWHLQNVFGSGVQHGDDPSVRRPGVDQGRIMPGYRPGQGGVIVWDDGDIETDLLAEREAYMALQDMPDITEDDLITSTNNDDDDNDDEEEPSSSQSRKRRASSQDSENDDYRVSDDDGARKRRRGNSSTPIPSSPGGNPQSAQVIASTPPIFSSPGQNSPRAIIASSPVKEPSARQLQRKLLKLRRKHEATLEAYYSLGTSYSEPVSSIIYSLASELGREDNDLLWLAIVGISSVELSPYCQAPSSTAKSPGRRILDRADQVREILRDEVRRLNPIPEAELQRSQSSNDIIPTNARSPTDTAIRLSPEPRFLLIRHWSLYDSMLHSSYLATRLHVWSEGGRKRLHKLLAKMGISLQEAGKGYVHMDMEIKRSLRARLLKFAEQYNLDGLVPGDDGRSGKEGWGFVRSWGWRATLSAADVANIVSAILEVGAETNIFPEVKYDPHGKLAGSNINYNTRMRALPTPPHSDDGQMAELAQSEAPDWTTARFFAAYDSLNPASTTSNTQGLGVLLQHIPTAQHLSRAILRTGSALISKKQIRHLRAFRMGVVKEGPDVSLFTHPGALVKLAAWLSEAVAVLEAEKGRKRKEAQEALVLGCLDENRGVYVVVGLGGSGTNGKRPKSKAELREREEKRKRKEAARAAKKAERTRKREEKRKFRREINEANGILDSDDEADDSDATESSVSSSGSEADSDDSDFDEELAEKRNQRGYGLNRFGQAFQEVVEETAARVRIDSFEHSVVEVRKEDLAGFLESLSLRSVVG
ncbi:cell division control protein 45 like protein [Acrodontium crateriforme]|uniref:Cell division control protein 45 like protein n=1 Tax=Acrodontium crateriforme TaxID=150365 RepID=A0AAQ3R710_9PEZI|nr:cell division control protein 45 like protein [Acrodontium crateriforme]